jgi:hypothetical protein
MDKLIKYWPVVTFIVALLGSILGTLSYRVYENDKRLELISQEMRNIAIIQMRENEKQDKEIIRAQERDDAWRSRMEDRVEKIYMLLTTRRGVIKA